MQITTLDHIPGQAWEEMGAPLFSEQVQAVNAAKDLVGASKPCLAGRCGPTARSTSGPGPPPWRT